MRVFPCGLVLVLQCLLGEEGNVTADTIEQVAATSRQVEDRQVAATSREVEDRATCDNSPMKLVSEYLVPEVCRSHNTTVGTLVIQPTNSHQVTCELDSNNVVSRYFSVNTSDFGDGTFLCHMMLINPRLPWDLVDLNLIIKQWLPLYYDQLDARCPELRQEEQYSIKVRIASVPMRFPGEKSAEEEDCSEETKHTRIPKQIVRNSTTNRINSKNWKFGQPLWGQVVETATNPMDSLEESGSRPLMTNQPPAVNVGATGPDVAVGGGGGGGKTLAQLSHSPSAADYPRTPTQLTYFPVRGGGGGGRHSDFAGGWDSGGPTDGLTREGIRPQVDNHQPGTDQRINYYGLEGGVPTTAMAPMETNSRVGAKNSAGNTGHTGPIWQVIGQLTGADQLNPMEAATEALHKSEDVHQILGSLAAQGESLGGDAGGGGGDTEEDVQKKMQILSLQQRMEDMLREKRLKSDSIRLYRSYPAAVLALSVSVYLSL